MILDLSKITITAEMLSLIAEIDEFKGSWRLFGKLSPEKLQNLRKVATIESVGSSTRIEGAKLSDREVERLLSNLETYSFSSRDEQEVVGYAYVCEEIFQNFEFISLSENIIKQLHSWLFKHSAKDQRHSGEYKKLSNQVEAFDETGKSLGVIFETATPFETPIKMQELVFWARDQLENKALHPLLIIGIFIVIFLAIHPFQDGNGRLSRTLTTLLLLRAGYLYTPYSSLESIIERNKEGYYLALRKTQKSLFKSDTPDFTPWLIFFLQTLQKQKIHLEQKVSREKNILRVPKLTNHILTLMQNHGELSITEIEKMLHTNRNTLKKHIANLVREGNLIQIGKGKATHYALP